MQQRLQAAVLGSTEAGRLDDLKYYLEELENFVVVGSDPILFDPASEFSSKGEARARLQNSWICAAVTDVLLCQRTLHSQLL